MNITLDKQVLAEVLGVPTQGTKSLNYECGFCEFLKHNGKMDNLNIKSVIKKSLKR